MTYAALNELEVTAADVRNVYLQAPSSEKHYIVCNDDFEIEIRGKVVLIRHALYGGKMAGHNYWVHMRACMKEIGFMSCQGDPDVWMTPLKKDDGTDVWEYFLLYTDDYLVISPKDGFIVLL